MKKRAIIGLTGPIASGKDTVAKMLSRRGAFIINADLVGHKVIEPQSKAWHGIVKLFGAKVLKRGGAINRKKLGSIAFKDKALLKKLDSITHPEMVRMIRKMVNASEKNVVVINAALLKQMKLVPLVDKVIVVLANKSSRIKRLLRSGKTISYARAVMKAQAGISAYRRIADIVIDNNGTIRELREQVQDSIRI